MILPTAMAILISTLITGTSYADDCSPFRLDEKHGTMENIAIREQTAGTCYAEVAAQLYDAYRISKDYNPDLNQVTSGFIAAIELAQKKKDTSISGGLVCDAFNFILDHGAVNESGYNQTFVSSGSVSSYTRSMAMRRSDHIYQMNRAREIFEREEQSEYLNIQKIQQRDNTRTKEIPELVELNQNYKNYEFMEKYGNKILKQSIAISQYYYGLYFPKTEKVGLEDKFYNLFTKYAENEAEFLSRIVYLTSFDKMRSFLSGTYRPTCKVHEYTALDSNKKILSEVSGAFTGGRFSMPASIGFCENLYSGGINYNPGEKYYGIPAFKDAKKCRLHAAIIIGRRKNPNTQQCEYLLRNSEGKEYCPSNLSSDWQCDRKASAVWINDKKLIESTASLEVIQ